MKVFYNGLRKGLTETVRCQGRRRVRPRKKGFSDEGKSLKTEREKKVVKLPIFHNIFIW